MRTAEQAAKAWADMTADAAENYSVTSGPRALARQYVGGWITFEVFERLLAAHFGLSVNPFAER